MSKVIFKEFSGIQPTLFPQNILDKIAPNHPVRLVNEVVNNYDISNLISKYKGGGASSFHPRKMLKVLLYSYLSNVYSCRKIERALHENIHFIWLSGCSTPDYRTINYLRGNGYKTKFTNYLQKLFNCFKNLITLVLISRILMEQRLKQQRINTHLYGVVLLKRTR